MSTTATSSADVIGLRRRTTGSGGSKADPAGNLNKTMTGSGGVSVLRALNGHSGRSSDEQDQEDDTVDDKFESAASISSSESSLDILPDSFNDDTRGGRKSKSPRSSRFGGNIPETPSTTSSRDYTFERRRSRNRRDSSPLGSARRVPSVDKASSSWITYDLSIVVALVSPIGNWLTGGDHVKNILLIVFLIFYLHQLIEVPWTLYQMSVPQHTPEDHPDDDVEEQSHHHRRYREALSILHAAHNELRTLELMYLFLSVLAPFLGATLLRHVSHAVTGSHEALSWFSTALFVLATGLRPWLHLIDRLKGRSEALNGVLTEGKQMLTKLREEAENEATEEEETDIEWIDSTLQGFEKSMQELDKRVIALSNETQASINDLNTSISSLSEKIKDDSHGIRHINKSQNKVKLAQDARIAVLEEQVKILLAREVSSGRPSAKLWDYLPRASPPISFHKLSRFFAFLLSQLVPGYSYNPPSLSRYSNSSVSSHSPSRPPLSLSGLMNANNGPNHSHDVRSPGSVSSPLDTIAEEDLPLEVINNPRSLDSQPDDDGLPTPTQARHQTYFNDVRSANREAPVASKPQLQMLPYKYAQVALFYILLPARFLFWILWTSIIITPIRAGQSALRVFRSIVFNSKS